MKKAQKFALILSICLMTACGYHLRGSIALPAELRSVYIFGMSGVLNKEMKGILKASNAKLAESPNDAGVVIKVLREDMRQRVISVGQTGKSSEVALDYYLKFQFYDNQENPLLDEQTIELSREFFNDQTAYLGKENEEKMIIKEMYRQVARMILSRAEVAVETKKR
ncbi:MAG: LPS-assembly lipoprotein LptE [Gammaproteobacteria bacterium]